MTFRIRPLDDEVDKSAFRCGQASLDAYIQRYASQDVRRGLARVFVATPHEDPGRLAGFFSLSAGAVNCADLPTEVARKLPWCSSMRHPTGARGPWLGSWLLRVSVCIL